MLGKLQTTQVLQRPDLLARPVLAAIQTLPDGQAGQILVAPIDADLADTAAFCDAYDIRLEQSANCVVVAGRRGDTTRYAAAVILATTRADVNNRVRKRLDARRASFAPMEDAVSQTGMEYGGITPIGLPSDWPVLVDAAVISAGDVVIGSGLRASKVVLPGSLLADLANAELLDGLGMPFNQ